MPSIIDLLLQSLRLYRSHMTLLIGYLAWLLLPYAGILFATLVPNQGAAGTLIVLLSIAGAILWVWITILVVLIISKIVEGKPADTSELQKHVKALFMPTVLVALLQTLVVIGGLILLIIPGLIFSIWYQFAPLAAILDGKRGMTALSYSRSLVQGRFWRTVWLLVAGPTLLLLGYALVYSILILIISIVTGTTASAVIGETTPMWMDVIDTVATTLFITPVMLIYTISLYRALKVRS